MATDKITYDRYKHMGLPHDFAVALAGGTGSADLIAALSALLGNAATAAALDARLDIIEGRLDALEA